MNTKHTPGPWEYDRNAGHIVTQGISVCRISACSGYGEHDDNARLIAAAPALLALAQEVVAAFPALDSEHEEVSGADVVDWLTAFRLQCRAVLANATGAES